MAKNEGARASVEFICVFLVPDVCKSPTMPVPYKIYSLFDCAVNHSKNVKFRTRYAFHHKSRLATVRGDEAGVGGGILSGVNMGFCRPVPGTHSKSVRVNGTHVDYHRGTYMYMNCAGPEGQFNTIGKVLFLGNMLPGPVIKKDPAKEPPKSEEKSLLAKLREYVGDVESLIDKAKKLYEVAKTDWTNPASVLGAIGGLAGVAGYKEVSEYAKKAKEIYEKGKNVAEIDWSDPVKALGGIAGVAGMFGVEEVAKPANLGRTVGEAIKADWSKPKEALEAAKNLMKETGLNKVLAGLISDAITGDNTHSLDKTLPSLFPKPGQEKSPAEASKEPSDKKSDSEKDKSSSKDKKDDDSKKKTKFSGKDGILITTKQGNPTALAAAIEAAFREANAAALKKAQAEERKQQASVQDSPEASSKSRTAEPQPTPTPRPQPKPTPTPAASANPSPDSTQTEPPTTVAPKPAPTPTPTSNLSHERTSSDANATDSNNPKTSEEISVFAKLEGSVVEGPTGLTVGVRHTEKTTSTLPLSGPIVASSESTYGTAPGYGSKGPSFEYNEGHQFAIQNSKNNDSFFAGCGVKVGSPGNNEAACQAGLTAGREDDRTYGASASYGTNNLSMGVSTECIYGDDPVPQHQSTFNFPVPIPNGKVFNLQVLEKHPATDGECPELPESMRPSQKTPKAE